MLYFQPKYSWTPSKTLLINTDFWKSSLVKGLFQEGKKNV